MGTLDPVVLRAASLCLGYPDAEMLELLDVLDAALADLIDRAA